MPRIPRIKFPQRHPPKSSATPPTSDQHLFVPQPAKSQPKEPATKTGERPSYRFRSDVPAPPSNTALGGKASLLPKRTPVSEEQIEAIMVVGCVAYTRGPLVFIFNFHPEDSHDSYCIGAEEASEYQG